MRSLLLAAALCLLLSPVFATDQPTKTQPAELDPLDRDFDALPAKDGWSRSVNGLQARLVFGPGRMESGTWVPSIYVELHNVLRRWDPMELSIGPARHLTYALRTKDGQPAPRPLGESVDGFALSDVHVSIPGDGILRFPITWSGHGLAPNQRIHIDLESAFWTFPKTDQQDYFLSAVLTIEPPAFIPGHPQPRNAWSGKIEIPPVKAESPK